jgi:hypothetical protein
MFSVKLLLVSVAAAFGCVGDGCVLTATSTALAFRWSALKTGLLIGVAHFLYESLGMWLSTMEILWGEDIGHFIALFGSVALLFCVTHHSRHVRHEHADGSTCTHHDRHTSTAPLAALSIIFITSADAFLAGVSIPSGFEELPRYALFLSAALTATLVGIITGGFLAYANHKELTLANAGRAKFRKISLGIAYCFICWLFFSSAWALLAGR